MRCVDGATDVKFTTEKRSLSVGEELLCTAKGNPIPDITLGSADVAKETRSGEGWRSLVVQSDWVGRTLTVECIATNNVDGQEFSRSNSITFNVTGEPFAPAVYLDWFLPLGICFQD